MVCFKHKVKLCYFLHLQLYHLVFRQNIYDKTVTFTTEIAYYRQGLSCVCVCVCVYTHICVCTYVCMYIFVWISMSICGCLYMCVYLCGDVFWPMCDLLRTTFRYEFSPSNHVLRSRLSGP